MLATLSSPHVSWGLTQSAATLPLGVNEVATEIPVGGPAAPKVLWSPNHKTAVVSAISGANERKMAHGWASLPSARIPLQHVPQQLDLLAQMQSAYEGMKQVLLGFGSAQLDKYCPPPVKYVACEWTENPLGAYVAATNLYPTNSRLAPDGWWKTAPAGGNSYPGFFAGGPLGDTFSPSMAASASQIMSAVNGQLVTQPNVFTNGFTFAEMMRKAGCPPSAITNAPSRVLDYSVPGALNVAESLCDKTHFAFGPEKCFGYTNHYYSASMVQTGMVERATVTEKLWYKGLACVKLDGDPVAWHNESVTNSAFSGSAGGSGGHYARADVGVVSAMATTSGGGSITGCVYMADSSLFARAIAGIGGVISDAPVGDYVVRGSFAEFDSNIISQTPGPYVFVWPTEVVVNGEIYGISDADSFGMYYGVPFPTNINNLTVRRMVNKSCDGETSFVGNLSANGWPMQGSTQWLLVDCPYPRSIDIQQFQGVVAATNIAVSPLAYSNRLLSAQYRFAGRSTQFSYASQLSARKELAEELKNKVDAVLADVAGGALPGMLADRCAISSYDIQQMRDLEIDPYSAPWRVVALLWTRQWHVHLSFDGSGWTPGRVCADWFEHTPFQRNRVGDAIIGDIVFAQLNTERQTWIDTSAETYAVEGYDSSLATFEWQFGNNNYSD